MAGMQRNASIYFSEIAQKCQGKISKKATELSNKYKKIAKLPKNARDKKLADNEKITTLRETKKAKESCISEIEALLNAFRS